MPVPQTLTSGALGLATKWSASSMHTLRLPWAVFAERLERKTLPTRRGTQSAL